MNKEKTKQRFFDIKEYSEKVKDSLKKLEQTQQPGQQSGKQSKTAVLESAKAEIQELVNKGYTTKQIADALRNDVFDIIPKTITQLLGTKSSRKQKAKAGTSQARQTRQPAVIETSNETKQQSNKPVTKSKTEIKDVD